MNKSGITPTQLVVRIVIIIIVLVLLLLVSFSMIKLVPKVFTSISDLKNLIHTNATSTATSTTNTNTNTTNGERASTTNSTQNTQKSSTTIVSTTQTKNSSQPNLIINFTKSNITNSSGTIIFTVKNTGSEKSGPWKFSAVVPRSSGTQNYTSPLQTNIPAGKTSTLTLNFDNAKKGAATITINGTTFTTQVN